MKHHPMLFMLCLSVLAVGCSPNIKEGVVGKWEAANAPNYALEFGKDGTMKLSKDGYELEVLGKKLMTKYRLTDKNIVEAGDDANPSQFKFSVQFEGEQLVVTGEGDSGLGGFGAGGKWEEFPPKKGVQQKFNRKR